MMTPSPEQRLETWLTGTIPEGQHLDFKATLQASTTAEKRELLKDVTAMGNGGAERSPSAWPSERTATSLSPITSSP
jgi:hypothetical protein